MAGSAADVKIPFCVWLRLSWVLMEQLHRQKHRRCQSHLRIQSMITDIKRTNTYQTNTHTHNLRPTC